MAAGNGDVFGISRLRLPREERAEVVASLRESGLSIRAIETATGSHRETIIKDLRSREVVGNRTPAADQVPRPAIQIEDRSDQPCSRCHRGFRASQKQVLHFNRESAALEISRSGIGHACGSDAPTPSPVGGCQAFDGVGALEISSIWRPPSPAGVSWNARKHKAE